MSLPASDRLPTCWLGVLGWGYWAGGVEGAGSESRRYCVQGGVLKMRPVYLKSTAGDVSLYMW